jgi:hypothetical protein
MTSNKDVILSEAKDLFSGHMPGDSIIHGVPRAKPEGLARDF